MGFAEGRAEMIDAVFSELGDDAEFVPLTGDVVSCSVRFETEQEIMPDYQSQTVGFRQIIRYQFSEIARDLLDGEYFIVDEVKYYVSEMVESENPDMVRRVRVTTT